MRKEEENRKESNLFEGIVSLRALLDAMSCGVSDRKIETVFYQKDKVESSRREYDWLLHTSEREGFSLTLCEREEIDAMTVGNTHGGIAVQATGRTLPFLTRETALPTENGGFYVMMEGVEDPYNFGYALRTFYAAGVDGVLLGQRNWMSAAGVVCRASAGASELLPMYIGEGVEGASIMKEKGFAIVCADLRESESVFDVSLRLPLLLIVGGEKRGISRALLDCADRRVRLDYKRPFEGSLSAASAASVLAYEIFRQNR